MTQSAGSQGNANWYYAIGQDRQGPIAEQTLRTLLATGQVPGSSLVWTDGMPNWVPAHAHPDLQVAVAAQMPGGAPGLNPSGPYVPPLAPGMLTYDSPYLAYGQQVAYAGFWLRFAAAIVDGLILLVPGFLLQFGVRAAFGLDIFGRTNGPQGAEIAAFLIIQSVSIVIGWLYEALQTSSRYQATLGKRACGIRVTDLFGRPISFGRATGRHFGKILSGLTLLVGYVMAGFTQRKQALHDIMAGTLVVKSR